MGDASDSDRRNAPDRMPRWLAVVLLALVLLRVGYHAAYLAEVPFAIATFSDGRLYERAAFDLASNPPLGTQPFYLQGLYAVQLALPMAIHPWISASLLFQLALAGVVLWGFYRAARAWLGPTEAGLALAVLMAYPGLAFYENKYLTAALAVATLVAMALALARLQRTRGAGALVWLGAATGLAILARGNMLLATPGVVVAALLVCRSTERAWWRSAAWVGLGLALALTPMAARNAVVTGQFTIMPAHGGGTSFYIGNNKHARGVWNTAGGLLSGEVINERDELVERLGIATGTEAEEAAAIGSALYRRGLSEMADDPPHWLWLEVRKAWLLIGNDELSQDYDIAGERELVPWWTNRGPPFSVLLALGIVGAIALRRRARAQPDWATTWHPWAWLLGSQAFAVIAANLLFFTSAQHRVPLVVPLAMLGGPALCWLASRVDARTQWFRWGIIVVVVAQGFWPRIRSEAHGGGPSPSAVHYYNLAIAYDRLGQPDEAFAAYDRAIERRPHHPVMLLERASLHRRHGHLDRATADLNRLATIGGLPPWVARRASEERRRVAALRQLVVPR